MKSPLVALFLLLSVSGLSAADGVLRSKDRVALVGNTFIERSRHSGHLEAALSLAAGPEVTELVFRNLGWSGDSVLGDARSYFGPPAEGRERLKNILAELAPTVVILSYGTGEAMSVDHGWTDERAVASRSAAGLDESLALFRESYAALLSEIKAAAGPQLREVILLSPTPLENLGDPLPDHTENNRRLGIFRNSIRELAAAQKADFVDLFAALGGDSFVGSIPTPPLTDNGIHFTDAGYAIVARELCKGLGYNPPLPDQTAYDQLRTAIVEKDRLFFHRWRPANETYLFLFRKHEQGQNAKEIPLFDPLITAQETRINEARAAVFAGLKGQ
jgi:lysophospholipase L1-like esterase